MDPSLFTEYKRIPNLGAKNYISELASTTDWGDSSLDIVMDIGCGAGVNSTYWIDHYFPNIRRLIGIDIESGMIDLAKEQNKKEKIEFYVADMMENLKMDPAAYMRYNRIPNLFAEQFIDEMARTTSWRKDNLDIVMDIGCGPGNISTYWIDHYFPNIKRLIGIDMDPEMIALAKQQNDRAKIEFHTADIMEKDTLKEYEGCVSRIFSNFMLHRVEDQKQAFKNIFDLLEPSGEAALSFILKGPYYFAYLDLLRQPKWSPILEPTNFIFPEAFIKGYDTAHYKQMFEDVGFNVLYCETKSFGFPYESDEECKSLLYSLHSLGSVTDALIEEYKTAISDQYMKYDHRDSEGFPVHYLVVLHAKLRKDVMYDSQV